jgi:hypothetical protein
MTRRATQPVVLAGCMVGVAVMFMGETAWATGPSNPVAIELDDDAVSTGSTYPARAEGRRAAVVLQHEGVRSAKLRRRSFFAGKLVDDRYIGDFSWGSSLPGEGAGGTPGQRAWIEIPRTNLEDGYHVEEFRAEVRVEGADRPVEVRAYRYYRVANGIRTRINSRIYSDATAVVDRVRDQHGVWTEAQRGSSRQAEPGEITDEALAPELQDLNDEGPRPDDVSEADED